MPAFAAAAYVKDDAFTAVGARATGMGGAFTSVSDDFSSFYWNPAGLVFSDRVNIGVFFDSCLRGKQYNYGFNYTHPLFADMTAAATYMHSVYPASIFSDDIFYLSYATYINPEKNVSAGINLKFINISAPDYNINGFTPSVDTGVMIKPDFLEKKMRFGLLLQDIDAEINWGRGFREKIPAVYRAGASYFFDDTAVIAADIYGVDYETNDKPARYGFNLGGEKWFRHKEAGNFGFRAGLAWREAREPNHRFTFGFSYGREDFVLDYVYVPGINNLGETHKINFSYLLGKRAAKKALKQPGPPDKKRILRLIKQKFKNMKMDISQKYISPNNDGKFDKAVISLSGAPEIRRGISWRLLITNDKEEKVKEYKGGERLEKRIKWGGLKDKKEAVKDGDYTLNYKVFYRGQEVWEKKRVLSVDTVPPRFRVSVSPKIFAPHKKSRVKELSISIKPRDRDIKYWELFIKDEEGNTVRKMSGRGFTEKLGWSGKDALGAKIKDGGYRAVVALEDFAGNKNENIGDFTVDTYIAKFNALPESRIFDIGGEKVEFVSNMRDYTRVEKWSLEIRYYDGGVIKAFRNKPPGVKKVVWNGANDRNEYVRPGEVYRYRVIVFQRNGIQTKTEGFIQAAPPEFKGMGIELTLAAIDFDKTSDEIPESEYSYLNQAADAVKKYAKNYYLFVKAYASDYKGHEENLELSIKRALAVKEYLSGAQKVPAVNIYVTGYGDGGYFGVSAKEAVKKSGQRAEVELMTK